MWKIKLDANGAPVIKDGMVVYVDESGKEMTFDANHAFNKIAALGAESKSHREKAEEVAKQLKVYEGLDAETARKALETVKNLDDKKLVDAGEVENLKKAVAKSYESRIEEITKTFQKQVDETSKRVEEKDGQIFGLMVTNRFGSSEFVKSKLAVPSDMVEAMFGRNFKVENGKVVGFRKDGTRIISTKKPGDDAEFEEALEAMVSEYPQKERILSNGQKTGSGASGAGYSGSTSDLSKLSPVERIKAARAGK